MTDVSASRPHAATLLFLAVASFAAAAPDDLRPLLEKPLKDHAVPSIAAVAFSDKAILGSGAIGERKKGSGVPVTIADKYHIGSITKSMTATLAAILVEEGRLKWETTVAEALPGMRIHERSRAITLGQLLRHRAGLGRDLPNELTRRFVTDAGALVRQRKEISTEILKLPPQKEIEKESDYSNAGYIIAGTLLEQTTRTPWEKLITERLFKPLELKSAGFGPPANSRGRPEQPWGHLESGEPVPPGPEADNIPALGPAGTVHMALPDLARYGQWHFSEDRAPTPPLLKAETLQALHGNGESEGYQFGWMRLPRPWAGGAALTHNGSNTMFFAVIWLAPARKFGLAVATNIGGDKAEEACDEVASALVLKYCR